MSNLDQVMTKPMQLLINPQTFCNHACKPMHMQAGRQAGAGAQEGLRGVRIPVRARTEGGGGKTGGAFHSSTLLLSIRFQKYRGLNFFVILEYLR